ncbi:hypothetical protein M3P05_10320 [Sansalvadorimonas sp. 2012CJ34-2]|uniref:MFS transporter n=1 Tax=Parendozoicomonas callyspongiae TaxID=2942213 RepID=A0ABT0PG25_9GAMM|nr:hypothetical protein [Sansalvadorimonas sp. 2012CJ34-2]MCL6270314.1 hypothetical protein [Sansalvadorimonas sp. 2012CJ34-2]
MIQRPAFFYQFAGLHGFLTGLLPFFLPVILWRESQSMALISGFIAMSGLVFLGSLVVWEKLRASRHGKLAVAGSFIAEGALTTALVLQNVESGLSLSGVALLALLSGVYGCFYWLSFRVLFIDQRNSHGNASGKGGASGNRFGNFQLIVGILLKVGILAGALLLDNGQDLWLVALSWVIAIAGFVLVYSPVNHRTIHEALSAPPVRMADIRSLELGTKVRAIFVLDGLFLFLESYFWVLSLYQLSSESYSRLGSLVVGLAIVLSLVFLAIKRWIDRTDATRVFQLAVVLYALSWGLRAWLGETFFSTTFSNTALFSATVLSIAFMTSFFRLAFNKLFFDWIEPGCEQVFILAKSWYSQMGVALFFSLLALYFWVEGSSEISFVYWMSAPLSLGYICYTRSTSVLPKPVYL